MNKFNIRLMRLVCIFAGAGISTVHAQTAVEYIHTDAQGTPIAVTDSNRNVIERSEYEPFGQLLNRPLTDGPGFTGHVQDAVTGLTYMQQRYYDPLVGRFLSADPVTAYASPGENFSRYWYANNNPFSFTDPDGRKPKDDRDCNEATCPPDDERSRREKAEERQRNRLHDLGWGISVADLPTPSEGLVDAVAGFGDTLSFGITKWARVEYDLGTVNYESGFYAGGQVAGVIYTTAFGGMAGLRAAGAKGPGLEFSHWIPARMGGPRSVFNGNWVSASRHALSDPYRYRFAPRTWKMSNPMPSRINQQWHRIPWIYRGAGAGAAYGGASVLTND